MREEQENLNIFNQIVEQFLEKYNTHSSDNISVDLKYSDENTISVDSKNAEDIQKFISNFFRNYVVSMGTKLTDNTLSMGCNFDFVSAEKKGTLQYIPISIKSIKAKSLYSSFANP